MRLGFIVFGVVLMGTAWWMTQPLQASLFRLIPVSVMNPFKMFSFPVGLGGLGSFVYGVFAEKPKQ